MQLQLLNDSPVLQKLNPSHWLKLSSYWSLCMNVWNERLRRCAKDTYLQQQKYSHSKKKLNQTHVPLKKYSVLQQKWPNRPDQHPDYLLPKKIKIRVYSFFPHIVKNCGIFSVIHARLLYKLMNSLWNLMLFMRLLLP